MEQVNYLEIANSFWLWLATGAAVAVVFVQAFLFARKSYGEGLELGLTRQQMNDAIKSSAITALGPSFVVLSSMIARWAVPWRGCGSPSSARRSSR